jgi:hypothetical protein
MSKLKLDSEEQAILEAFEAGELKSTLTKKRKKEVEAAAATTFKKDKRINIEYQVGT